MADFSGRSKISWAMRRVVPAFLMGAAVLAVGCTLELFTDSVGRVYYVTEETNQWCGSPSRLDRAGRGPNLQLEPGETSAGFQQLYALGPQPFPCERRILRTQVALARWNADPAVRPRSPWDIESAHVVATIRPNGIPVTAKMLGTLGGRPREDVGCNLELHVVNEAWSETFAPDGTTPTYEYRRQPIASSYTVLSTRTYTGAETEFRWPITDLVRKWAFDETPNNGVAIVPDMRLANYKVNADCLVTFSNIKVQVKIRERG